MESHPQLTATQSLGDQVKTQEQRPRGSGIQPRHLTLHNALVLSAAPSKNLISPHHRQHLPSSSPLNIQTRPNTSTMSQQYPRSPYPHASPRHSPANRNPRRWNARAPTIDLTASPPSHSDEQPAAKRRRVIESVDLTELEADEDVLRRQQREDLLKTQEAARESEKRKVAGFTCVICMEDEPTDLAVTPCGL